MILSRIFRTYTFRFAVLYVLTISVTASVISALVYVSISYDYFNNVHEAIRVELENAITSFEEGGIEGFDEYVVERTGPDIGDRYFFVLADPEFSRPIAGNLKEWPEFNNHIDGWLSFEKDLFDWSGNNPHDFVGRSEDLDNGFSILVARHYEDVNQRVELVASTLVQSTIVMVLLGLIGGAIISSGMVRRIDSLNRSISTIMQGNLSERLPVTSRGGEIDELAKQLNIMLDRIESSMNDVRQVTDNIAHDLRTPLTRLRNKVYKLEKEATEQNSEMVREMLVESDHLLSTFNALLRIAQVEAGTKKSNFTDVDLAQIFVDVVELYEPLASVKDIQLEVIQADPCVIRGDKDLIFQMLVNLIDNATKYTPEGGAISTSLTVEGDHLTIIFADNGPGIPKEKYEKVFQRFYRVEESRGVQPGNGLGLSLVQAVAVLHGGGIRLDDGSIYHPDSVTPGLSVIIEIPLQEPLA